MDPVAGIGLRSPHLAEIARERPATGFLEIHAENYLNGSQAVEALRADYALSIHAVGLSLGSVDGLDEAHLARVAALVKRLEPLPYSEEALAVVVRNVQRLQEVLGRQISVENPSCYLGFAQSTLSEPEFLGELVRLSGCGLLLDVNNIAVTAHNLRLDPRDWLDLPGGAITQYHLAGHAVNDADGETILIDDHGSRVSDGVWALFTDVVQRFGRRPTLIEWDTDVPPLAVLLDEAARADRLIAIGDGNAARAA